MRLLPPMDCDRRTVRGRCRANVPLFGYALACLAAMCLSGCVTPAQELNFIDHHIIRRMPAQPPLTQIAAAAPASLK